MTPAAIALAVSLAQSGRIAVLSVVTDPRTEAPPVGPLASELLSEGWTVMAGSALAERLLGSGRPLAHDISRTLEQELSAAEQGYDRGNFAESARQAALAYDGATRAAPSPRREALISELQVLWGASLFSLKGRVAAAPHFREALQRNSRLDIDADRFAPPVRQQFEQERARVAGGPQVWLQIAGTPGASLFVDGLPRGILPLTIALAPHHCTVWTEVSGEPGLAHELLLTRSTSLSIDWRLEVASRFSDRDWAVELPASEGDRRALLKTVLQRAGADEVLALEWAPAGTSPATPRHLTLVRYGPSAVESGRELLPADGVDWRHAIHALWDRPSSGTQTPGVAEASPRPAPPTAGAQLEVGTRASEGSRFPWLAVGLVAGGVALAASAVAIGLSVHSTNAILLGPETPRP